MKPWLVALVLATVSGSTGCGLVDESCVPPVTVNNPQGEPYRCIASEDCPRTSDETLCVSDINSDLECIRCLDTRCVRVTPETCP